MGSPECTKHQAQQLQSLRNHVSPDSLEGQDLAILANAIYDWERTGTVTPKSQEAERIGLLRPQLATTETIKAESGETLKLLLAGAATPTEIVSQFDALPLETQNARSEQLKMLGALHALISRGHHEAFAQALPTFVKAGTEFGRGLQAMSVFYRSIPEYMVVDAQRRIIDFNASETITQEAIDVTPDEIVAIANDAQAEATATVEDSINEDPNPLMLNLLTQAQHEVLDLAKAMGKTVELDKDAKALRAKQKLLNLNKAQGLIKRIKELTTTQQQQQTKLNSLQQQLARAESKGKGDAEKLRKQLQEAQEALKETKGQVSGLEQQVTLLKGAEATEADLRAKLKNAQAKIDSLSSNIKASDKGKKLQNALTAMASELPEIEQQNINYQLEITDLKEKLTEQGKTLKKAQEGNWANKKTLENKVKKLESELKSKQDALEATLRTIGADAEVSTLTTEYENALKRVQELEQELASYDPREMLRQEVFSKADAPSLVKTIKSHLQQGNRDIAQKILLDMPLAQRDEVTKLLLC